MPITQVSKEESRTKALYSRSSTQRYILTQNPPGGTNPWVLKWDSSSSTIGNLGTYQVFRNSKVWRRDSDFRLKISNGTPLPELPFRYERQKRLPANYTADTPLGNYSGSWFSKFESRDSEFYGDWSFFPAHHPVQVSLAELQSKLLRKQRGESWQAPVFFAEAKKTSDMVRQRAGDLVHLLLLLKKGRARDFLLGLRNTLSSSEMTKTLRTYNRDRKINGARRAGANLWLESWYGWVPFVSDVKSAVETLESLYDIDRMFVGVTRTSKRREKSVVAISNTEWGGAGVRYLDPVFDSRRAVWRWKPLAGQIPSKLGLLNPLSIAWELLPLSFVADWFVPIGNWLDTLDTPMRVQHVSGSYGLKRQWKETVLVHSDSGSGNIDYGGYSVTEQLFVDRTAMSSLPVPGIDAIRFKPDLFAPEGTPGRLGEWHVATSIALLTQICGWFTKPKAFLDKDLLL